MKKLLIISMIIICLASFTSCLETAVSPSQDESTKIPSAESTYSAEQECGIFLDEPDYDFKYFDSFEALCAYFVPDEETGEVQAILEKAAEPEACSEYIDKVVSEQALWKPVIPDEYGEPTHLLFENYGNFMNPAIELRYLPTYELRFQYGELSDEDISVLKNQGIRAFLAYRSSEYAETYLNIPDERGEITEEGRVWYIDTLVLADGAAVEAVRCVTARPDDYSDVYMFVYKDLFCWFYAKGQEGEYLNSEFFSQFDIEKVEF